MARAAARSRQLILDGHQVRPAHEDAARAIDPRLLGTAFDHLLDGILQIHPVGGAVRVQHDEIERHALAAQILVGLEQVGEEWKLAAVLDRGEEDREVARDAVLPQFRLSAAVLLHGLLRSQARIAKEQPAGESLEAQRVLDGEAEVPQLDLRVGAGQGDRASDCAPVVVLFDEMSGACLAVGECGGERHACGAAGRKANRLAEADDRIEDGAGRVRERAAAADGDGIGEGAAPSDEPRAVGLVFGCGTDAAAAAEHMNQVHAVGPGPGAARAEQRVPLGHGRRFDEEIAERRVGEVGGARREDDLGVAGQIEAARPMTVVGDRHAPQLGVVFG